MGYSKEIDVWSLGIVAHKLATKKVPFIEGYNTPLERLNAMIKKPSKRIGNMWSVEF